MAEELREPPAMVTAMFRGGPLHRQKRRMPGYPTFRVKRPACDHDPHPGMDIYVRTDKTTEAGAVVYELAF